MADNTVGDSYGETSPENILKFLKLNHLLNKDLKYDK